jgi:regulator of ribonuclease activity A
MNPGWSTADLCDAYEAQVRVLARPWRDYGGHVAFGGEVSTVRTLEDNSRVREAVHEPGRGRVLLVDGGGSLARALLGDLLAAKAVENGWAGVVVVGAVRDSAVLATLPFGVKALGTVPRKTERRGAGERDVALQLDGIEVQPGDWLYADADGVLLSRGELPEAVQAPAG